MRKFVLPIIFIMIAVVYSSIVVVTEGTRGIMLRFGKVQRDADNKVAIYTPGLHFKIPFIDNKNDALALFMGIANNFFILLN